MFFVCLSLDKSSKKSFQSETEKKFCLFSGNKKPTNPLPPFPQTEMVVLFSHRVEKQHNAQVRANCGFGGIEQKDFCVRDLLKFLGLPKVNFPK